MRSYRKSAVAGLAILWALGIAIGISACNDQPRNTTVVEASAAEDNQQRLLNAYPVPRLEYSLERKNLIRRAERINGSENMVSCIDLFTYNGALVAHFVVDGKASSLNSYLLSGEKPYYNVHTSHDDESYPIEQADIDGAYGKNDDGIFFFEAQSGAYIEWKGSYLWTDLCLTSTVQPMLTRTVSED